MDEEEDWDAPSSKPAPKSPPPSGSSSTPSTTLRITDGYKYSYEAQASPANIEDWVEPMSFGGGRRSNGFRENRDNDRPFRNDRPDRR